jgi:hypothetical protein
VKCVVTSQNSVSLHAYKDSSDDELILGVDWLIEGGGNVPPSGTSIISAEYSLSITCKLFQASAGAFI